MSGGVEDFLCSYGGETRDDSSSSPVRTREEWPGERGVAWSGSDAKGRSFWSVSRLREARNEKRRQKVSSEFGERQSPREGTKDRCVETVTLEA